VEKCIQDREIYPLKQDAENIKDEYAVAEQSIESYHRSTSQSVRLHGTCQRSSRNKITSGKYEQRESVHTQQSMEFQHQFIKALQHPYVMKNPKKTQRRACYKEK
jgi:hypothetical protein